MNEHQFGGEHDKIATTISDVVQERKPPQNAIIDHLSYKLHRCLYVLIYFIQCPNALRHTETNWLKI